jgi:FkbM family methyltransferase
MPEDYRSSSAGRKRSWYGLKKWIKWFFSLRIPHALLVEATRFAPSLRASGRLPAPARLREVTGRVNGSSFVMLRPAECVVAKELYWGNGRRPRAEDAFAVELFGAAARRATAMVDIGAYTGLFTLVATTVNETLQAHAFEIVPEVFQALVDNCVRNDVLDRTFLYAEGVGRPDTEMIVPAHSHDSALPSFYSSRLHFDSGVRVRFRALDSLASALPRDGKVVVKVDVEGTEDAVFEYGQAFLEAFRPDVLCEVLHGVGDPMAVEKHMLGYGYGFYLVRGGDLQRADHVHGHRQYRDWFFTVRSEEELADWGVRLTG